MKKFFLSALVFMGSMSLMAQSAPGTVTVQPKVGLNIANMTNSDGGDPRIALVAGAELQYQISDMVGISGGLLYSMQGVKGSEEGVTGTIKLDYINVPILANIYVAKGFAVKLGIQPGFMVSNKAKVSANGVSAEVGLEKAFEASGENVSLNKFDFSIPVGLSYEFNNVVVDARYNWGVNKVVKEVDTRNSVFQITLGYKFAL
jgi:hypothetical protein